MATPNAHANGGRVNPLATVSVTFSISNGVDVTPFRQAAVRPQAVNVTVLHALEG